MDTEARDKKYSRMLWKIDDIVMVVIRIVFILIMLIGVYFIMDTVNVYKNMGSQLSVYKPDVITEETLKEISGNCIGWIEIPDSGIDYPIMQGKDNNEYLNRNPYGEYSLSGSIFLDANNASDFSDDYSIIYGHHMADKLMFGALDQFADESFFKEHSTGVLTVGDIKYELDIFAFLVCNANEKSVFSLDADDHLIYARENALYFTEPENEHIVALTTCKDPGTTDRTILLCSISESH